MIVYLREGNVVLITTTREDSPSFRVTVKPAPKGIGRNQRVAPLKKRRKYLFLKHLIERKVRGYEGGARIPRGEFPCCVFEEATSFRSNT